MGINVDELREEHYAIGEALADGTATVDTILECSREAFDNYVKAHGQDEAIKQMVHDMGMMEVYLATTVYRLDATVTALARVCHENKIDVATLF